MIKTPLLHRFAAIFLLAMAASLASAADYPVKPVRVVVPFPAGGSTDLIARLLAQQMEPELKQTMLVENRPGAGGLIGVQSVVKSDPDGYTLLITGGSAIGPTFIKGSTTEMYRDLAPISAIYEGPFVLFVQRSVPVNTVAELVAYARANPGKLNYGTTASNEKMLMEMFKRAAGLDIVEIPYKGGAPRTTALMANEVQLAIGGTLVMKQQGFDAKIKPMMAFGPNRSGSLPDVPTTAEMGYPALSAASTLGLWAPMNTERDIIARLNRIAVAALAQPAMKAKIRDIAGFDAGGSTPEELRARSKGERDFYVQAAAVIKLQPE